MLKFVIIQCKYSSNKWNQENTRIFICKCQYLIVIFAKVLFGIKLEEKHKMSKYKPTYFKCNMCNNTFKFTFLLHDYKKSQKWDKEQKFAVVPGSVQVPENRTRGQKSFRTGPGTARIPESV